jgi:hypothetical protein
MQLIDPMVTVEMNDELCTEFTDKEIADALFQVGLLKAPGPDGFPAWFFQRNWDVLKKEVITRVKGFFVSGRMV